MCVSSILAIVFITMYMYKYLSRRKLERVYYIYRYVTIFESRVLHRMCCDAKKTIFLFVFAVQEGSRFLFVCLFLFLHFCFGCWFFDL